MTSPMRRRTSGTTLRWRQRFPNPADLEDRKKGGGGEHVPPVAKRHRVKGPPRPDSNPHDTYMLKLPKTPRARQKTLEKELPWSMIPGDQIQGFKGAEIKQWEEHVGHNALAPLSLEKKSGSLQEQG